MFFLSDLKIPRHRPADLPAANAKPPTLTLVWPLLAQETKGKKSRSIMT